MSELIVDKITAKIIQSDTFNLANTALNVLDTTQSVSTSTGSITTKGGLGILGAANIGGNGNIGGSATIGGGANISGDLTISNTTQSATTSTGSIVAYGGIGILKNANIGGNTVISGYLDINSSVASSDTGTGSITTNGGIGILGDANIGGSATIGGLATCATAPILGQHLCNKTYVDSYLYPKLIAQGDYAFNTAHSVTCEANRPVQITINSSTQQAGNTTIVLTYCWGRSTTSISTYDNNRVIVNYGANYQVIASPTITAFIPATSGTVINFQVKTTALTPTSPTSNVWVSILQF